jgi:hypothetical protein
MEQTALLATIVNGLGHEIDRRPGFLVPKPGTAHNAKKVIAAEVRRQNGLRTKAGKPRLRVTSGMKMREFYKVGEDDIIRAYTPKQGNKNPDFPSCFHVGLYESPTGVFIPKNKRDDQ